MSTSIANRAASIPVDLSSRCKAQAAANPALLGPMSSDGAEALTHALVAEPYSSD